MTALFQRGPAEVVLRFQLNLDRFTIDRRSVESAICSVQSFVWDPLFTQRDFFTDNGISMLLSAVNVAGTVCEDFVYDPWSVISAEGYAPVVADLKSAYAVVLVRRKDARDTCERWFGVASVASSVVGESLGQQAVRISNVVEVGQVEYLPQFVSSVPVPSTSFGTESPGKGKQKKSEMPAKSAVKRPFEFDDESVVLPKGRGVYLMTPLLELLCEMQIKLFPRGVVVVVVVLHQSSSQVPDNFTYHCIRNFI